MSYTIDEKKVIQIGKELGLEVEFNSDTPGVRNKETREVVPLKDYFSHFFMCEELLEEDEDEELSSECGEIVLKVGEVLNKSRELDSADELFKKFE